MGLPVGHEQTCLDQRRPLRRPFPRRHPLYQRPQRGPAGFGFGREIGREAAPAPREGQPGHVLFETFAPGEEQSGGHGPLQIEVGIVLPGEADATENLDTLLGAVRCCIEGEGSGHLRTERPFAFGAVTAPHRRGIPCDGGTLLHGDQHVGQGVLDRLELTDGSAELHAHLGVLGRRVEAPAGHAGSLGRRHDQGQIAHFLGCHLGEQRIGWEGGIGEYGLTEAPGGIERGEGRRVGVTRVEHAPATLLHRREQHGGRRQSEHGAQ